MLKSALIAMTVMGCDCDAQICIPLDGASGQFASVEECESALVALVQSGNEAYPLLKAECKASGPASGQLVADTADAPEPLENPAEAGRSSTSGTLVGQGIEYAGQAGSYLLYRTSDGFVAVRTGLGRAYGVASRSASGAASWIVGSLPITLPF
ncbi:hypothetical protein ABGN05_03695 [Aquibium sp. LZ166]|uniref:Uncharacterized protein n=1 Tax=Aquibium pacificus TaxID=3153579 RepID=A0ABV3SDE3_9HYPH